MVISFLGYRHHREVGLLGVKVSASNGSSLSGNDANAVPIGAAATYLIHPETTSFHVKVYLLFQQVLQVGDLPFAGDCSRSFHVRRARPT
jgi:hypothetical protein